MGAHVWGPAYLRDHLLQRGPPRRLGAGLVRRLPRLPVLHGGPGADDRRPRRRPVGLGRARPARHRARPRRRLAHPSSGGSCAAPPSSPASLVAGPRHRPALRRRLQARSPSPASSPCRSRCYVAARLADLPFPGPPLLVVGAVVFLFNREPVENGTGNIIGGNVASTLAGEFSFSISLAFLRALHRVPAAGLADRRLPRDLRRRSWPSRRCATSSRRSTPSWPPSSPSSCRCRSPGNGSGGSCRSARWPWPCRRSGPVPFVLRRATSTTWGGRRSRPASTTSPPPTCSGASGSTATATATCAARSSTPVPGAAARRGRPRRRRPRRRRAAADPPRDAPVAVRDHHRGPLRHRPAGSAVERPVAPFYLLCTVPARRHRRRRARPGDRRRSCRRRPDALLLPGLARDAGVGVARRARSRSASRSACCPGGSRSVDGAERWFGPRGPRRPSATSCATGPAGTTPATSASPPTPSTTSCVAMMRGRRRRPRPRLRSGHVGVRERPPQPLRHADGARCSCRSGPTAASGRWRASTSRRPRRRRTTSSTSARCRRTAPAPSATCPYGSGFDIDLGIQQLQQMGVRYYLAFSDTAVAAAATHPDLTRGRRPTTCGTSTSSPTATWSCRSSTNRRC